MAAKKDDNFTGFEGLEMPYSLDSEQSVLGAILVDPSAITAEGMEKLRSDHFYLPQHQVIYDAMFGMFAAAKPIDPVTLLEELRRTGNYEASGGKEYLARLAQMVPSLEKIRLYAEAVIDKYYLRSLIIVGRSMADDAMRQEEDASVLLDAAEQRIFEIRQGRDVSGLVHVKQIINEETARLSLLNDPAAQKESRGITTGISTLNNYIGGFNKSDLIIIGARPGVGKTSFCLNLARNAAISAKKRVAFFSLEMTNGQLVQRLLSSEASIESSKMRFGGLTENDEWPRLAEATSKFYDTEIYLDDTAATTVPQMKAKLRRNKPDIAFIDYLQLIEPANKKAANRVQEVTEITRALKIMAKELNIPVIVCAQLSRLSVQGTQRRPQMSDLRESGSIEQDADIILLLYREEHEGEPNEDAVPNNTFCIVAKNRHGATGDVEMRWNGQFTRYEAVAPEGSY